MDWNEIIDVAVYGDIKRRTRGSGLRMPWSYKLAKHTSCGGKGCEECKGTGKIIQVSYLPLFVYKSGILSMLQRIDPKPNLDILKMTTVRTNTEDHVTVEHPSISVKEGSFTDAQTKDEIQDEELREMIGTFVQQNMLILQTYTNKKTVILFQQTQSIVKILKTHTVQIMCGLWLVVVL
jgi:hypothetical protein